MHYLMTIVGTTRFSSDGVMSSDAIEAMNRAFPAWNEKTKDRRLFGRELDLPGTASVVRVRDGEPLVVDGPFAETKEFMAGFDLLDCADLDDAIEVASSSPVARKLEAELRRTPAEPTKPSNGTSRARCMHPIAAGTGPDSSEDSRKARAKRACRSC